MLKIRSASLAFGERHFFRGLDLSVGRGQLVGLTGESGCGKTSLLRAILGFVPLAEGAVEVDGLPLDAAHVHEIRRRTAYLPQELQPPAGQGRDLLRLTLELDHNRRPTADLRPVVMALMEELALAEGLLDLDAPKLSGGQRQRLLLVAALALDKPLLLLDEPSSALDEDSTQRMAAALLRICREQQRGALVVSHDPVLLSYCDSRVVMP